MINIKPATLIDGILKPWLGDAGDVCVPIIAIPEAHNGILTPIGNLTSKEFMNYVRAYCPVIRRQVGRPEMYCCPVNSFFRWKAGEFKVQPPEEKKPMSIFDSIEQSSVLLGGSARSSNATVSVTKSKDLSLSIPNSYVEAHLSPNSDERKKGEMRVSVRISSEHKAALIKKLDTGGIALTKQHGKWLAKVRIHKGSGLVDTQLPATELTNLVGELGRLAAYLPNEFWQGK